jgi:hypothetical protein
MPPNGQQLSFPNEFGANMKFSHTPLVPKPQQSQQVVIATTARTGPPLCDGFRTLGQVAGSEGIAEQPFSNPI